MNAIKVARLHPNAVLPTRKHPADAGIDVYALNSHTISPHQMQIVPTGVTFEIPDGYFGLIKPKGKNNHLIGSGVVDAGYQGELLVKIINPYDTALAIQAGDAIAQLILIPVLTPSIHEVTTAEIHQATSARGKTGGIVDLASAQADNSQ